MFIEPGTRTAPSGDKKSSSFSTSSSSVVKCRRSAKKDLLGTAFISRYRVNRERKVITGGR